MKHKNKIFQLRFDYGKMKFFKISLVLFFLLSSQSYFAQQIQNDKENTNSVNTYLTGVVLDHDKLPLPNMSIVLKGTEIGTATNFDGEYIFPEILKEGDVLIFSALGYAPKAITIGKDQKILNITLEAELVELMGAVDGDKVYKTKRNLWLRIKGLF
ncbi:carboxypeptidase-like regulatory domain-containing protein [Seonamhaeicola sp. ML3]|uniref:carboxypeptidase-like regulatory domain-containing protein n=1 Tax=Seonamhaeicola sp. ML3 TaxID=2937786 RepID=UPI00200C06F7|nr:carboxypeptidase-like regulatory domain-containing protein [Seonamhaeicola sp. ML3]